MLATIAAHGGRAIALEAVLADAAPPVRLFDAAEAQFGPVDILVNNATGWLADSLTTEPLNRFGHRLERVSTQTFDRQFAGVARGSAALIS